MNTVQHASLAVIHPFRTMILAAISATFLTATSSLGAVSVSFAESPSNPDDMVMTIHSPLVFDITQNANQSSGFGGTYTNYSLVFRSPYKAPYQNQSWGGSAFGGGLMSFSSTAQTNSTDIVSFRGTFATDVVDLIDGDLVVRFSNPANTVSVTVGDTVTVAAGSVLFPSFLVDTGWGTLPVSDEPTYSAYLADGNLNFITEAVSIQNQAIPEPSTTLLLPAALLLLGRRRIR